MPLKTLIFVPTYNERDNVENMVRQLAALGLDADLLFMDDNSPDGTGGILDRLAAEPLRLEVIHRSGKLGIGSAHIDGIRWAYDHGYDRLITLDCDFTHTPADVARVMQLCDGNDLVAGSRYMLEDSLPGWNLMRKSLTGLGHLMTKRLLGIQFDATGALRGYDLRRIPRELFDLVKARGYAFFFESMFLLVRNGFSVREFPIVLPARTYGSSKMSWREAGRSASQLLSLWAGSVANPSRFRMTRPFTNVDPSLVDPQGWNAYWDKQEQPSTMVYEFIARGYRVAVIKRQLERHIARTFSDGAKLLHAGCGSGQVDESLHGRMQVTAIDISPSALHVYQRNNPAAFAVKQASILALPFPAEVFDGVYNLGVVEHFDRGEISMLLAQFHRVLKPEGKLVIFWPHSRATSVAVLRTAHWLLNDVMGKPTRLHPPEVSLLRSQEWARSLLRDAGFRMVDYSFGPRDLFVQAVVVAEKLRASA
ncbi:MAG: glycosyltransferase [Gemmatimonadota bacterium]|nr:glycosyltransferase [Gemmatimonadota bacterium]